MSTRSTIWVETEDGFEGIYSHYDGYIENNGKILFEHYDTLEKVQELIAHGELSVLGESVEDTKFYNEGNENYKADELWEIDRYTEEYNYLFKDGNWYLINSAKDKDIKRLEPYFI